MTTTFKFLKRFSNDDICLDYLFHTRFGKTPTCPKCGQESKFYKIKKEPAYACGKCGHHVHPMAGTLFENSRTPLQKWFYAMHLFTMTRHGVSAKELQRQLGITYKTAWRMGHEIRKHMAKVDGDPPLTGHVEIDETYVGGKRKKIKGYTGRSAKGKTIVMGIMERGGEVFTKVVPKANTTYLINPIRKRVPKGTRISTDEWAPYRMLKKLGYDHHTVDHSKDEWARGDTHVNTLEGFWSIFKKSVRSTHIHISRQHMSKYLGEFEFRFNRREAPSSMLDQLLRAF